MSQTLYNTRVEGGESAGSIIEIYTDAPPQFMGLIMQRLFERWIEFARGQRNLDFGGLSHPTGKYAASISYKKFGETRVMIEANEAKAPEAKWIEWGHRRYDMKQNPNLVGRTFPMHRMGGYNGYNVAQNLAKLNLPSKGHAPKLWAKARAASSTGFAKLGKNAPADSWVIPEMKAYHPALILAKLAGIELSRGF